MTPLALYFIQRQSLHHSESAGDVVLVYITLDILAYISCEQRHCLKYWITNSVRPENLVLTNIVLFNTIHSQRTLAHYFVCMPL